MKVVKHIAKAKNTLFSFEILPPKKGQNIQNIYDSIDPLMEFKPAFIDVTYHREEYMYKKMDGGLLQRKTVRKRPGTVAICAAIQYKYNVDAVPHIICGGFSKEDTENALIDLAFLGIDNILVLRGDPIPTEKHFVPEPDGHAFASDLIEQVVGLNQGKYLDNDLENTKSTDFCLGVAGYPEKHFEAPNFNVDLQYLKNKVDQGAEYIVTQLFFDNQKYFDFVEKCRAIGIEVPIIPGIKPLATIGQLTMLPKFFHCEIPDELTQEVMKCKDNKTAKEVGIEWAVKQCKELIDFGVPVLHFYTMSRAESTKNILEKIF